MLFARFYPHFQFPRHSRSEALPAPAPPVTMRRSPGICWTNSRPAISKKRTAPYSTRNPSKLPSKPVRDLSAECLTGLVANELYCIFSTDKKYAWCLCGKSKSQPICDGTHKNVHMKIKLRYVELKIYKSESN